MSLTNVPYITHDRAVNTDMIVRTNDIVSVDLERTTSVYNKTTTTVSRMNVQNIFINPLKKYKLLLPDI